MSYGDNHAMVGCAGCPMRHILQTCVTETPETWGYLILSHMPVAFEHHPKLFFPLLKCMSHTNHMV